MQRFAWLAGVLLGVAASQAAWAADGRGELERLFADERAFTWREDPLSATADGVRTHDDRLPGVTPADQARRLAADREFLARLRAIDRSALTEFDAVSHDLFEFMVSQRIALGQYREWRAPLNSDSGFYADILQLHDLQAPRTVKDYENFVLMLDWRIEAGGDSGVYLRGTPQVQIWDNPIGSGGLYNNQVGPSTPTSRADKPVGEWNSMLIEVQGGVVNVWLNGVHVVRSTRMENYWERGGVLPARGPIELQAHGSPLWFRDVYVRELP